MKKAASYTKRKYKPRAYEKLGITRGQVEQAAKATTEYLKNWTKKELNNLTIKQNVPVCLPLGDRGFLVGRFRIEEINQHCWRVLDINGDTVCDFGRKLSAVFYCLTTQLQHYNLAYDLLKIDHLVSKLEQDKEFYTRSVECNEKKQDYFRADVARIRCIDVEYQLKPALEELQKTINRAKYLKVQERLL